ncbi:ATP-binding protein [Azonexus sp. IMCC34839]|uniref:ATP-binding protein n=1 Tax=Azonexus sp. IMCC34839 TaxID=3133695 RepID=UPI00399B5D5A
MLLTGISLVQSRAQYEQRAEVLTQNIAQALDQNVSNNIARIDLALGVVVDELEHQLAEKGVEPARMNEFLDRQEKRLPEAEGFRVADAEGKVILGKGVDPAQKVSWADRDYFLYWQEHNDSQLQISKPRMGRVAKQYIIGFSRRYNYPDGRFAGVVSAPIALEHLSKQLSQFDLGKHGTLILRDNDLGLIARHPPIPDQPVGRIGNASVSPEFRELAQSGKRSATYHLRNSPDGYERILTFHRLDGAPMIAIVGMASDEYLASWYEKLYQGLGLLAGFIVLSILAGAGLLRLLKLVDARQAALAVSVETEQRRQKSLRRLSEISSLAHVDVNEQLRRGLALGAEHLGLEFAIISRVDGTSYRIVVQLSPPNTLQDGQSFSLGNTYCSLTLAQNDVLAIPKMGESEYHSHPCYREFALEAYIGAAIRVNGEVFGTLNFSSPKPYARDFDDGDREFIALMARWVGSVIERDQARQSLAASEDKLRKLYEMSPLGIALNDMNGRFVEFNAAFGAICGYSESELKQLGYWELTPKKYEAQEQVQLESLARTGRYGPYEKEYIRKDGSLIPLRLNGVNITTASGERYIWSIVEDISESKRHETELLNAREAAEAGSRAKSAFLATMSHEIRTPMNGILGMAQLLLLPDLDETERQDFAKTILNSGEALLKLLNDVLDLSKVEAGKLEFQLDSVDPALVIHEVYGLFVEQAHDKNLEFTAEWLGSAETHYELDPLRLRQMLVNLISNAIKFTAGGYVRVTASEIERQESEAVLEFSVADSGIGIPEEKQHLLFKPFSQIDASNTRGYGGTGLGLSIVRNLAELMSGTVGVESEPGNGARIWFRIKARIATMSNEPCVAISAASALSCGKVADSPLPIMVVEDNPTNRKVIEALLHKMGYQVLLSINGAEAVTVLESASERPALILMDVQMPVMDGIEATKQIRQQENDRGLPQLPIIALTAGAFDEDRQHCLAAGMDDFLTKPIQAEELSAALKRWIESGTVDEVSE